MNKLREIFFSNEVKILAKVKALAILLLFLGIDKLIISKIIGRSIKSIPNYKKGFLKDGFEYVYRDKRYKPSSSLMPYAEIINKDLDDNPCSSLKEVCHRIETLVGIKVNENTAGTFITKVLKFKLLQTAQIPAKADPVIQKDFLENTLRPKLEKAKKGNCIVLFVDACHCVLSSCPSRVWALKRIFVRSSPGRYRVNVLGAINPITNKMISVINDKTISVNEIIELFAKIRKEIPKKKITLVLDNARYQHCDYVIEQSKLYKIELLFLPTYSPNLNLIERVWKIVKKKALYSTYYSSNKLFKAKIIETVEKLGTEYFDELSKSMSLNFQLFDNIKDIKVA